MLTGIVKLKTVQFKKFSKILSNDVVHYILKSSTFETKFPSNSYIFKKNVSFQLKVQSTCLFECMQQSSIIFASESIYVLKKKR